MEGLWEYLIRTADTDLVVDTHEGAKRWSSILRVTLSTWLCFKILPYTSIRQYHHRDQWPTLIF